MLTARGEPSSRASLSNLKLFPAVLALYSGLAVIMTWPIARYIGEAVPGGAGDVWVHWFAFRTLRESLLAGQWPPVTDMIFYPHVTPLAFHNIAYFHALLWIPLQTLIGEAPAYSIIFLLTFVLNGFAVFLLARELTRSDTAAFLAGLIVAFWPYILGHHHHPNLNLVAWVPLTLLFLRRMLKHGRVGDAVLTGLFAALIGISRWQMLVLGGILVGVYALYHLVANPEARNRRVLGLTGLAGLVALALTLPFMWPVWQAQMAEAGLNTFLIEEYKQTDLLAYFVPSSTHRWWGEAAYDRFYGNFDINALFPATIGYTTLALALFGAIRERRRARFWILATLLYVLLALGPELLVNGRALMPLPYDLVDSLFVFKAVRNPDRFNVILSIPVAMLASYGYLNLKNRLARDSRRRWLKAVLLIPIALMILVEYVVYFPVRTLAVPGWYHEVAESEEAFAILDLPHSRFIDKDYMRYQMVHGKPIAGGRIARPPENSLTLLHGTPLMQNFPNDQTPPWDVGDVGGQLGRLAAIDVRYLVLHPRFFEEEGALEEWREWLILEPVHEDAELVIYRTDYTVGQDTPFRPTSVEGLGMITSSLSPTSTAQEGWINATVTWGTTGAIDETVNVCLDAVDRQGVSRQSECMLLSKQKRSGDWAPNELIRETYSFQMNPFLESGDYDVQLSLASPDEEDRVGAPVALGTVEFEAIPRVFAGEDQLQNEQLPRWGDAIALGDYEVVEQTQGVQVTLNWLALRRMEASYKVFLHLFEAGEDSLLSQVDTVPRDWAYPTTWWEKGEIVTDTYFLPLEDPSTVDYTLTVGLYERGTEVRLPLRVPAGQADRAQDNTLRLATSGPPDSTWH